MTTIAQLDPNLIRSRASVGKSKDWPEAIDIIIAKINELIGDIGSAPVGGSGTANTVAKWFDADTLTDSSITDSGTVVAVAATLLSAAGSIEAAGSVTAQARLQSFGVDDTIACLIDVDPSGWTNTTFGMQALMGGTISTASGGRDSVAVYGTSGTTRSAGASALRCIGLFGGASNGQENWAGFFEDGDVFIQNMLEIDGALNHDGTTVGFYSATPVVKATGIAALTDNTGGTANDTLAALADGVVYANDVAVIRSNFADLAAKVNAIRTVLLNLGLLGA